MIQPSKPCLLLVGWDAADWKVIDPLLAKGHMPNLGRLVETGVRGNLATIQPPLSPMVWTSIATGKRPPKHGILGFSEPTPDGMSVRPVSNLGRKTKALWNIANQSGLRSIVVGWWPSHPAEPIRGAMVSDLFPLKQHDSKDTPLPLGAVWPVELSASLAEMRVHVREISPEILTMFVPEAHLIDQEQDQSLTDMASIVAETMSIHNAATELMETQPWDLAAIYFAGIDHFCHRFMRYHAGKRAGPAETNPALFTDVVENGYRYHDVMLGRLMALAGPECAVMVVSDHGFHSDRLLPDYIPAQAAGPAVEHRSFGIFCLRGPGVHAGERVYGATVLDVAPTALHVLGLPAGRDMDGKVLLNAFHDTQMREPVESWDEIPGEDGRHSAKEVYDGTAAAESLKQLVDLGYVAPPGADAKQAVDDCLVESRYNLAQAYADAGQPEMAVPMLRELTASRPEEGRFYVALAYVLLNLRDLAGCRRLLDQFDHAVRDFAPRAAEELKRRRAAKADKEVAMDQRDSRQRREIFERRQFAEKAAAFTADRLVLRCRLALLGRSPQQKEHACELLERLATARRQTTSMRFFLAQGFAALKHDKRALEQLEHVRRADSDNWQALALEARIHFDAKRYRQAVDRALASLSLTYFQPQLYQVLGMALVRLDEPQQAEQAFRMALQQAPEFAAAHDALGRLLRRNPASLSEAGLHLFRAEQYRRKTQELAARRHAAVASPEEQPMLSPGCLPGTDAAVAPPPADRTQVVTVVAGLPRSGTSMMMQMLAAGGIEPYTDQRRLSDEDNPRGYLEHEQTTRLHTDSSWVPQVRGKAIKVVAHLLPDLPAGEQYRLILMYRNLEEVAASQKAMLQRLGREGSRLAPEPLRRVLTQQLVQLQNWLQRQPHVAVLAVNYAEALSDPEATAARLERFLGAPFDRIAAACAVVPALRRQKAGEPPSGR